jgi:glycosyltransferase involved in cell wall biosynthesis
LSTLRGPLDAVFELPAEQDRDGESAGAPFERISVIIANYNYADYVGEAIESALRLDWDDVEVIVVDDGSTDDSADVIRGYGDRIQAVFQPNSTQRVARNVGYAMSTGDVVIHLDSDDVLRPELPRRLAEVWRPGVSKVQVQMERIDARSEPSGSVFPRFRRTPTPEQVRHWAQSTSAYPTPPGSGNVYSRHFLDQIFPLDDRCGPATDSACLAAAPFLGDVLTIAEPLVGYRVHGDNTSNMLARDDKFARAIERARARFQFSESLLDPERVPDERPLFRSRALLQLRVAAARLTPQERPLPSDGRARMLRDTVAAAFAPGPETPAERVVISAWSAITLVVPQGAARRLVRLRYGRHR